MDDEAVTDETTIEDFRRILRGRGLQATAARIAVLQVLWEEHEHRSAEQVRVEVLRRYPTVDPATVYRTLETLEQHGLAVRMTLGDRVVRWARVSDQHHHLVCRRCGAVVELDDAPFQQLATDLAQRYGVRADLTHLVLQGYCATCAASTAPS